jgi:hypothetical protein
MYGRFGSRWIGAQVYRSGSRAARTDEQAVLFTVKQLLDTVARRDKEGMRRLLVPAGAAVQSRDHQVACTSLADLPENMPGGQARLKERFYTPLVRVDDDIAVVWARYDFLVDGRVHHWGTNILTLLKQGGVWRVSAVADNGRTGPRPEDWGDDSSAIDTAG